MIPLIYAQEDANVTIKKVSADEKTKRHLENLGVLVGAQINLVSINKGNVILKVKDGRLALNQSLATKILLNKKINRRGKKKWKSI